jgi:hypothetical protein
MLATFIVGRTALIISHSPALLQLASQTVVLNRPGFAD